MKEFERVELLIGKDNLQKLNKSSVAVFGVGGVGGYVCEALARSGIGNITVIDNDRISESNINRQIIATSKTLGEYKVEAVKNRLLTINPDINVNAVKAFYMPENADSFSLNGYDYVVDAIDTVTAKLELIERAKKSNVKVISCMGTGGKLSPLNLKVADISKTKVCPLARVMRRELKKRNITSLKVVYSEEEGVIGTRDEFDKKIVPSMIFVPSTAGLVIASEIIKDIIKDII